MQDNAEAITVCGVHRDTVDLLNEIRTELAKNTTEVAKVSNSLGWIKWVIGGFLGVSVTVLLVILPLLSGFNARLAVLEHDTRTVYETSDRGLTQSSINIAK